MTNAASSKAGSKPWESAQGGEGSQLDPLAARFVESLSYDTRLYDADIRGSLAHAQMLAAVGLLSADELKQIESGLAEIRNEIETAPAGPTAVNIPGAWPGWKIELEDVHMCIEAALIEKIGDPGRKLHTGRSRNDQVALDLRLWLRSACNDLVNTVDHLMHAFEKLASQQGETVIPSYTHLQRAQPICVGAEAMAWWAMFERDREMLTWLIDDPFGLGASPLGSGAIAGSSLPLDRDLTASTLGFIGPALSSIDATASRDEALDFLYAIARIGIHLSRLSEQWIIYASTEFSFLKIGSAYTTGSSMMPQKRNPDMLELIRGRCGNLIGALVSLLTICKGLPIGYNRDLQEDKRHVFAAFDTVSDCVKVAARVVESAIFKPDAIARAGGGLDRGYLDATALAEYLVRQGIPFRSAHQIVGSLVRICDSSNRHALSQLTLEEISKACTDHGHDPHAIASDVFSCLGAAGVVKSYISQGHAGMGPGGYRDWLDRCKKQRLCESPAISSTTTIKTDLAAEPKSPAATLFGSDPAQAENGVTEGREGEKALIQAYLEADRGLDDLPYTEEFEGLYERASGVLGASPSRREMFRRLQNLRKAGKLPKLGKRATQTTPPKISIDEEQTLAELVIEATGTLGQRDQLPYTHKFDAVVAEFNQRTGRCMTPHDIWRLIQKLAK